jgi:hypothetical protein
MSRKRFIVLLVLAISLFQVVPAFASGPDFMPHIYADGVAWSTKGLNPFPAPNAASLGSFERLYGFTNGAAGQLAVAEAGPGNPAYNGGRWYAQTATWTAAGLAAYNNDVPVLKSESEVQDQVAMGYLTVTPGAASGPTFFECPLLPVKN